MNDWESFYIDFPSVGTFPSNGTVFLAPTVTSKLLELHYSYHHFFQDFNDNSKSYYIPEKWVPHRTMMNHLNAKQFLYVMEYVYQKFNVKRAGIEKLK